MRSVMVVEVLEGIDMVGDCVDLVGQLGGGVELVAPCAIASLDSSVEFRRSGRQNIEGQVPVLAGFLELGHELRTAVDLDGLDGPGHLGGDLVEEVGGILGGGAFVGLCDGPFCEDVISIEMLDGLIGRQIDGEGIDLDNVPRPLERNVFRLADGVRSSFRLRFAVSLADQVGNRRYPAALDQMLHDATDGSVGDDKAGLA